MCAFPAVIEIDRKAFVLNIDDFFFIHSEQVIVRNHAKANRLSVVGEQD
jgi:hypothetical protein